jgi:hypothetical protein
MIMTGRWEGGREGGSVKVKLSSTTAQPTVSWLCQPVFCAPKTTTSSYPSITSLVVLFNIGQIDFTLTDKRSGLLLTGIINKRLDIYFGWKDISWGKHLGKKTLERRRKRMGIQINITLL